MDPEIVASLALIALAAVLAPLLATLLRRFRVPSVVLEIGLGILIGPYVLKLAEPTGGINDLAELGLAFLMFLAGYEIELDRLRGRPIRLAFTGWLLSIALAFAFAFALVSEGAALSTLFIGLALTTTALGTLLPIVRDAGILETRLGGFVMAVGTVGEFGPIVAIAVLLTGSNPKATILLLVLFLVITVIAATVMLRNQTPAWLALLQRNLHSSTQLPVRISVLLVIAMVWLASQLGLDVLLGAFAAGMIVRLTATDPTAEVVRGKLEAIGFGFLIPLFFVVSGMKFDLEALLSDRSELIRVPMFLLAFLAVRGIPALVLYRRELDGRERGALALLSGTQLPLVVVITSIGVSAGRMLPVNAAGLVGAAMLSVLIYPTLALAILKRKEPQASELSPA